MVGHGSNAQLSADEDANYHNDDDGANFPNNSRPRRSSQRRRRLAWRPSRPSSCGLKWRRKSKWHKYVERDKLFPIKAILHWFQTAPLMNTNPCRSPNPLQTQKAGGGASAQETGDGAGQAPPATGGGGEPPEEGPAQGQHALLRRRANVHRSHQGWGAARAGLGEVYAVQRTTECGQSQWLEEIHPPVAHGHSQAASGVPQLVTSHRWAHTADPGCPGAGSHEDFTAPTAGQIGRCLRPQDKGGFGGNTAIQVSFNTIIMMSHILDPQRAGRNAAVQAKICPYCRRSCEAQNRNACVSQTTSGRVHLQDHVAYRAGYGVSFSWWLNKIPFPSICNHLNLNHHPAELIDLVYQSTFTARMYFRVSFGPFRRMLKCNL